MDIFDKQVLVAIQKHYVLYGYSPSIREISEAIHVNSTGLVHDSLRRLREMGHVTWMPRRARTIKLVDQQGPTITVVKLHKGVPSVLMVDGRRYVLEHKDTARVR